VDDFMRHESEEVEAKGKLLRKISISCKRRPRFLEALRAEE
jgi:hypothetical protein